MVIRYFETAEGTQPFKLWINALRDLRGKASVFSRIDRLQLGLLGDCKSLGEGVYELRIDVGPGYRVYFGREGPTIVILLCGGNKASQRKDVAQAKTYWRMYRSQ